ncbi:MAG: hypothetical protein AAF933_13590 [Pseudomonadota bacterium]
MRVRKARLLCLLALACGAGAQESSNAVTAGASAQDAPSVAEDYRRHRLSFHRERAQLLEPLPDFELEMARKQQELRALRDDRRELMQLTVDAPEDLAGLRAATRGVETATFFALQPLVALTARAFSSPSEDPASSATPGMRSETVSRYLSFLLPATLVLILFGLRRFHRELYGRHRKHLQMFVLSVAVLLPLSSFAQEAPTAAPSSGATQQAEIHEMLRTADEVLSLTRVQRYIRWLSSARAAGRRLRISDVDLSATPFTYFDSVVGGSGEFYMTLAALHLADGNRNAALRQMLALADPGTRYASRNANPQQYEAMFATAAAFLMDNEAPELGEGIISLHLAELRERATFEAVFSRLIDHSFSPTALALAEQLIAQTSDVEGLLGYARALYDSDFATYGQSALQKALESAESAAELRAGFDLALAQREDELVQRALSQAGQQLTDLKVVVDLTDALRDLERESAAQALLAGIVDRARSGSSFTIGAEPANPTQTLSYLSAQAFDRGMLNIAETAAVAAVAPLSRVERAALTISTPSAALDPLRIPEPEKLVSPLYFGLLDEGRGRTAEAKLRYTEESRELLANLLDSNGLYVPDMMNHLALLGGTLSAQAEPETLARLDRVLLRLERDALEELRAERSAALGDTRPELAALDADINATLAELAAMREELKARERSVFGLILSALLLVLRMVSLLAVCAGAGFVVVQFALRYSQSRAAHRGHAFGWKLFEGLGWAWVVSVFSAPLGLFAIVVSQFFMLFQERSELAFQRRKETLQGAKRRPAAVIKRPPAKRTETEQADQEWSRVIQMLREG